MERETNSTETHGATGIGVAVALVLARFFQVGFNTIVKSAITKGMSNFVFIVYSNAMAFCFLLPSTFFFYRMEKLDLKLQSCQAKSIGTAVFVTSTRDVVNAWACHKKESVYVVMFKSLGIVIVVCLGFIFLGDSLHLGSLIGAVVIAIGFYAVIWGKAQEEK